MSLNWVWPVGRTRTRVLELRLAGQMFTMLQYERFRTCKIQLDNQIDENVNFSRRIGRAPNTFRQRNPVPAISISKKPRQELLQFVSKSEFSMCCSVL